MPKPSLRTLLAAALCLLSPTLAAQDAGAAGTDGAIPADDPSVQPAEKMSRVPNSLLLDIVEDGPGIVAVGERGHVIHSQAGQAWIQAESVPTRSTLTSVTGIDSKLWAAGHDGVILHSSDDGRTWQRQRVAPRVPGLDERAAGIPLLDILFLDDQHGFAVGAYSLLLETRDGGRNWEPHFLSEETAVPESVDFSAPQADAAWTFDEAELELEAEADPHLNAIARTGSGGLIIAGERGSAFRSRDGGQTWERFRLPYEGSMFGVLAWEDDHVLMFGLRGNVLESDDLGDTWREVPTGTEASLMGGRALPGGGAVLVGASGTVLHRATADDPFRVYVHTNAAGETPVLSSVLPSPEGGFVLAGERGVDRFELKD